MRRVFADGSRQFTRETQVLSLPCWEDEILFCLSGNHLRATLDGCVGCELPKALDPKQGKAVVCRGPERTFFPPLTGHPVGPGPWLACIEFFPFFVQVTPSHHLTRSSLVLSTRLSLADFMGHLLCANPSNLQAHSAAALRLFIHLHACMNYLLGTQNCSRS